MLARAPAARMARSWSMNGVLVMSRSTVAAADACGLATSCGGWTVTKRKTSEPMGHPLGKLSDRQPEACAGGLARR